MTEADYPPTRPATWITADQHPFDEAVHLGQGVYTVPQLRGKFPTDLGNVELELTLTDGRYTVRTITLRKYRESPPITSELLRKVRVQELVNENVPDAVAIFEPNSDAPRMATLSEEERARLVKGGPNDELLRWVGRLYIVGQLLGTGSAKHVRETLGIPASTAGNWIRRAKDRGYVVDA